MWQCILERVIWLLHSYILIPNFFIFKLDWSYFQKPTQGPVKWQMINVNAQWVVIDFHLYAQGYKVENPLETTERLHLSFVTLLVGWAATDNPMMDNLDNNLLDSWIRLHWQLIYLYISHSNKQWPVIIRFNIPV